MALPLPTGGQNAKHYILATLTATLVSAAIITVVFVVLRPAHIHFSLIRADYRVSGDGRDAHLNFALSANNPSRRAAVRYQSMYVQVSNSTKPVISFRGDVTTPMPLRQPTRNATTIAAAASMPLVRNRSMNLEPLEGDLVLIVITFERFKVGIAWTRLYYLRLSCGPINDFFYAAGRRRSHTGLPVDCQILQY